MLSTVVLPRSHFTKKVLLISIKKLLTKKVMVIKKLLTLAGVCNADYHDLAARNSCVTKVFSEEANQLIITMNYDDTKKDFVNFVNTQYFWVNT